MEPDESWEFSPLIVNRDVRASYIHAEGEDWQQSIWNRILE